MPTSTQTTRCDPEVTSIREWAERIAATLPPMTPAEVAAAGRLAAELDARRQYGVPARLTHRQTAETTSPTTTATPDRAIRCRYLRRNEQQCTAEVADPDGPIPLCTKHLARAFQMVKDQMATTGGPR